MFIRQLSPEALLVLLALVSAGSGALVAQSTQARTASVRTTQLRRVPLEGAANFRDLGGYPTTDGRHVRWGLVYRSNHLADLTTADYQVLNGLGIRVVCDLRTEGERKRSPTVWRGSPEPEMVWAPVLKDADVVLTPERLKELTSSTRSLDDTYGRMVTESPDAYGRVLRRIAHGPLPAVTHCTAGKDRTGVFSALLLSVLGVFRDIVIDDYMLTARYMNNPIALHHAAADWQRLTGSDQPSEETLRRLYETRPETLRRTFDAIDRAYGSFDAFVRDGLGLSEYDLAALRNRLLE